MITGIRLLQFTAITFYHNLARFSAVNIIIPANDFLQIRIFFADSYSVMSIYPSTTNKTVKNPTLLPRLMKFNQPEEITSFINIEID